MPSQQVLQLWKSQVPLYQRIISRCTKSLITPLTKFLPPDFDDKLTNFKEFLENYDIENYQNYLDIIVHHIEGVKNKSNIELADMLVLDLGGNIPFWQNVILDVAQNVNYAGQFTLWHIRKVFDERLYVDGENLNNYRKLCKISKSYLLALKNLIKYIQKFDIKKDSFSKIDELFKKVKDSESKYVQFTETTKICEPSITMDDVSNNISQRSRQNAIKNLFNFPQKKNTNNQKSKNTLFNYNFKKNRELQIQEQASKPLNILVMTRCLKGQALRSFESTLKKIDSPSSSLEDLRNQFAKSSNKHAIKSNNEQVVNICDRDWFFNFQNFKISLQTDQPINFVNPYEQLPCINYDIDDEEHMNELVGEDVDGDEQLSSVSEISCASFIVSDGHASDNQENDTPNKKPSYELSVGDRWSFSNNRFEQIPININPQNYQMICMDSSEFKYPLPLIAPLIQEQDEQQLFKIIDGQDKKTINELINKQKIKISKNKLDQFLKRHFVKGKSAQNSSKAVYKLKTVESQNSSVNNTLQIEEAYDKQNLSRKSKNSSHHSATNDFKRQEEEYLQDQKFEKTTEEEQTQQNNGRRRSKRSRSRRNKSKS